MILSKLFKHLAELTVMPQKRIDLIREAASLAPLYPTTPPFIAQYPRADFYKAVYIAIENAALYLENNNTFFCDQLQLPKVISKVALLQNVQALADFNAPLNVTDVDKGLRCISAVINIGIKGQDKIAAFTSEIWPLLKPLLDGLCNKEQ